VGASLSDTAAVVTFYHPALPVGSVKGHDVLTLQQDRKKDDIKDEKEEELVFGCALKSKCFCD